MYSDPDLGKEIEVDPDPDLDPDPAKCSGSGWIRIRIRNAVYKADIWRVEGGDS